MHIIYNGQILQQTTLLLNNNRAFRYGDALFETIRVCKNKPVFLESHLNRLMKGMGLLKMMIPDYISLQWLRHKTEEIIVSNQIAGGARIRLTFYRSGAGLYLPETSETDYIMEISSLPDEDFIFNENGLKVGVYSENKRSLNELSQIKTTNCLVSVMASMFKKENDLDDCILLNEKGFVAEAISSNIFVVKQNKVFTPAPDQGCVVGTMRNRLIEIMKKMNVEVIESAIHPEELLFADELFITNAVAGIRWIEDFNSKKIKNTFSANLFETFMKREKR